MSPKNKLHLIVIILLSLTMVCSGQAQSSNGWRKVTRFGPSARYDHAMTYSNYSRLVFMFGGADGHNGVSDQLWQFDTATESWRNITTFPGPGPRYDTALAHDSNHHKLYLFGGRISHGGFLRDMWAYDIAGGQWSEIFPNGNSPTARAEHDMVYDPKQGRLILFGGYAPGVDSFDELWEYDPVANQWQLIPASNSPGGRIFHKMAYDSLRNVVYLYGGSRNWDRGTIYNDLWVYNPMRKTWNPLPATGSDACTSPDIAFDNTRGVLMLYGGGDYRSEYDELWEYNPDTARWEFINVNPESAPPALGDHAMVFDEVQEELVLFGGHTNQSRTVSNETWIFHSFPPQPTPTATPFPPTPTPTVSNDCCRLKLAGFWDTALTTGSGGELMVVAYPDPDFDLGQSHIGLFLGAMEISLPINDDGLHGDFTAGDGVYGARVNIFGLQRVMQYPLEMGVVDSSGDVCSFWPYLEVR